MTAAAAANDPTVLVVDDEPPVLAALRRTLRRVPCRVLVAASAEEALEVLGKDSVDVLLSDIDMPRISGLELTAYARQAHPTIVRMLITGRGSMQTALTAINEGEVFRYLTKPWSDGDVRSAVSAAIDRVAELRRNSDASRAAERKRRILERLEREQPGITKFTLDADGVYEAHDPDFVEADASYSQHQP